MVSDVKVSLGEPVRERHAEGLQGRWRWRWRWRWRRRGRGRRRGRRWGWRRRRGLQRGWRQWWMTRRVNIATDKCSLCNAVSIVAAATAATAAATAMATTVAAATMSPVTAEVPRGRAPLQACSAHADVHQTKQVAATTINRRRLSHLHLHRLVPFAKGKRRLAARQRHHRHAHTPRSLQPRPVQLRHWPRLLLVHLLLLLLALSVLGDPGDSPFSPLLAEGDASLVTFESTRADATRASGACTASCSWCGWCR